MEEKHSNLDKFKYYYHVQFVYVAAKNKDFPEKIIQVIQEDQKQEKNIYCFKSYYKQPFDNQKKIFGTVINIVLASCLNKMEIECYIKFLKMKKNVIEFTSYKVIEKDKQYNEKETYFQASDSIGVDLFFLQINNQLGDFDTKVQDAINNNNFGLKFLINDESQIVKTEKFVGSTMRVHFNIEQNRGHKIQLQNLIYFIEYQLDQAMDTNSYTPQPKLFVCENQRVQQIIKIKPDEQQQQQPSHKDFDTQQGYQQKVSNKQNVFQKDQNLTEHKSCIFEQEQQNFLELRQIQSENYEINDESKVEADLINQMIQPKTENKTDNSLTFITQKLENSSNSEQESLSKNNQIQQKNQENSQEQSFSNVQISVGKQENLFQHKSQNDLKLRNSQDQICQPNQTKEYLDEIQILKQEKTEMEKKLAETLKENEQLKIKLQQQQKDNQQEQNFESSSFLNIDLSLSKIQHEKEKNNYLEKQNIELQEQNQELKKEIKENKQENKKEMVEKKTEYEQSIKDKNETIKELKQEKLELKDSIKELKEQIKNK